MHVRRGDKVLRPRPVSPPLTGRTLSTAPRWQLTVLFGPCARTPAVCRGADCPAGVLRGGDAGRCAAGDWFCPVRRARLPPLLLIAIVAKTCAAARTEGVGRRRHHRQRRRERRARSGGRGAFCGARGAERGGCGGTARGKQLRCGRALPRRLAPRVCAAGACPLPLPLSAASHRGARSSRRARARGRTARGAQGCGRPCRVRACVLGLAQLGGGRRLGSVKGAESVLLGMQAIATITMLALGNAMVRPLSCRCVASSCCGAAMATLCSAPHTGHRAPAVCGNARRGDSGMHAQVCTFSSNVSRLAWELALAAGRAAAPPCSLDILWAASP